MFQFPGFALKTLCIQVKSTWFNPLLIAKLTITNCQVGCPIQRSVGQSLFSTRHRLSQSITSFIASYCQGIHQTPFSRLIWSRKSKARHGPSNDRQSIPIKTLVPIKWLLEQKSYIFPTVTLVRNYGHVGSNLSLNLVSVLDLDNSVCFSRDI